MEDVAEVLCLGRHHHSGHTLDLAADGKDKEILFHKFNIIGIFFFSRGPDSVR